MPPGHQYTSDIKSFIFRIIKFVEGEKGGPTIPMYNVNDRLMHMLNISHGSLVSLKHELRMLTEEQKTSSRELRSIDQRSDLLKSPKPMSPRKTGHCGPKTIILSEYAREMIRFEFHLLVSEKQYPTLRRLLLRLKQDLLDFPINSITTLSKHLKQLGFVYKKTASIKVMLDSTYFVAERARYFHCLNLLKKENTVIYFQDETWCNANEEKRSIWIQSDSGEGKFRTSTGKGKRLIVNALINSNGFHLPSIEIFESDELHSMNSNHFVDWIQRTSGVLRTELGPNRRICIVLDNATWHNKQTEFSRIPSRSCNKDRIRSWLEEHRISYLDHHLKAELLELCHANAPPKQYMVDNAAASFDVEILRLPVKHCMLNPIELAWACMKAYIRDRNTSFKLQDVCALTASWLAACDEPTSTGFFNEVQKYESAFKEADHYLESLESTLLDTDNDDESDLSLSEDETVDSDDNE